MTLTPLAAAGPDLTSSQRERYARQLRLPGFGEDSQRRLASGRVLVVGAGGLGSPALLYLAAAGVGTIGIIDDDVVDLTNLHRQVIHTTAEVGVPKTASAAKAIHDLNPEVRVIEHACRITEDNAQEIISDYDLVLDGTDNFLTRYTVDAACSQLSVPEIWGSILRYSAQVSVFWTGPNATAHG
ncbi:MAG: ThiF family adenylyltransferase, partial [Ancrocorticia sp.]|nr:ThiF family adenylyltransferase [Ancrocorticia sp.]